jgi:hypothetical protein
MSLQDGNIIESLEVNITELASSICKNMLFFCETKIQSTIITILHYLIFIIGIYYFYFVAKPKSLYKKIFFIFCLMAYIAFLLFDKCLCSSIEYKLHNGRNFIQEFMGSNFGDGEVGKTVSKSNLLMISLFIGLSLLYDYRICNTNNRRKY